MHPFNRQRGASLIVVIVILLVLGVVGAVFVSLMNTESFTATEQSAGPESYSLADGGLEIGKRFLRPYANWYAFPADPATPATAQPLGSGTLTTTILFPATALSKTVGAGNTTICVRRIIELGPSETVSIFH